MVSYHSQAYSKPLSITRTEEFPSFLRPRIAQSRFELASPTHPPPIHHEHVPGHVVRRVGSQEDHGPLEILGQSPAIGRDPLQNLPRPGLIISKRTRHICREVARGDRIHLDVIFRPIVRERLDQLAHGSLARCVGRNRDAALKGQLETFTDAATLVDQKWDKAHEKADRVRTGYAELMEDESGEYTLGSNTHELLIRFLSAIPLVKRPKLITTTGEFLSIRRQLDRLEEAGIEVVHDSRQGNVHHSGVQEDHKTGHHHHYQNMPFVGHSYAFSRY